MGKVRQHLNGDEENGPQQCLASILGEVTHVKGALKPGMLQEKLDKHGVSKVA